MSKTSTLDAPPAEANRRTVKPADRPSLAGIQVRPEDIEPTQGIRWVGMLFRLMSGLLLLLMVVQVFFGLTGTVEISYGVLFAEAIRLLIFAGLLWAAAALADLYVKSHYDLRATRILVARLTYRLDRLQAVGEPGPAGGDEDRGHGDAGHTP
jgi:hypothetical protein